MRALVAFLACASCGTPIEDLVTIHQGVYGQVSDRTATVGAGSQAATVTPDRGFYQLELPVGTTMLCVEPEQSCTSITVETGVIRWDWDGTWHRVMVVE